MGVSLIQPQRLKRSIDSLLLFILFYLHVNCNWVSFRIAMNIKFGDEEIMFRILILAFHITLLFHNIVLLIMDKINRLKCFHICLSTETWVRALFYLIYRICWFSVGTKKIPEQTPILCRVAYFVVSDKTRRIHLHCFEEIFISNFATVL